MKNFAKILMLLLVVALACGLVFAMSITSAADADPIEVASWQDIIDAYASNASPVNVKLTADIKLEGNTPIDYQGQQKNLVIDLNGKTISTASGANGTNASAWNVLFGVYNRPVTITVTGTGAIALDGTKLYKGHIEKASDSYVGRFGFNILGTDADHPIKVTAVNTSGTLMDGKNGDYNFKNVDIDYITDSDSTVFNIEATLKHTANYNFENANVRFLASGGETPTVNYRKGAWMFKTVGVSSGNMSNANYQPADVNITAKNCTFLGSGQFVGVGGIGTAYTATSGVWNSAVDMGDGTIKTVGAAGTGTNIVTPARKVTVGSVDYWMAINSFVGKDTYSFENCDIDYGFGSADSRIYLYNEGSLSFKNCNIDAKVQDFVNVCFASEQNYSVTVDGGTLLIATNAGAGNTLLSSYNSCEWGNAKAYDGQYGIRVTPGTVCSLQFNYNNAGWKAVPLNGWGVCYYGIDAKTGFACSPCPTDTAMYYKVGVNIIHVSTAADFTAAITAAGSNIVMLDADISLDKSCTLTGTPVLFMNGKTISWTGNGDALFLFNKNCGIQVYGPGHFDFTTRIAQPYQENAYFRLNDGAHNTAADRITAKKTGQTAYQVFMIGAGELSVTNFEVNGNGNLNSHFVTSYAQNQGTCYVNIKNVKCLNGGSGSFAFRLDTKFAGAPHDFVINVEDSHFENRFISVSDTVKNTTVDIKNSEWILPNDSVAEAFGHGSGDCVVTLHEGVKITAPNVKDESRTVIGYHKEDVVKCADGVGFFLIGQGEYETRLLAEETPAVVLKNFGSHDKGIGRDVYVDEADLKFFFAWANLCTRMGRTTFTVLKDCSYTAEAAATWKTYLFDIDLNGHKFTTECAKGVYYILLLQKGNDTMNITDSVGGGKLVIKNQQFAQFTNNCNVNITGTAEKPVNVEHMGGGYFIDLYNGTTAVFDHLNYKHNGGGFFLSVNPTSLDVHLTIKNSVIDAPELPRILHSEEIREGEARFIWTAKFDATIENSTINAPKGTLVNHKVVNGPYTLTVTNSDLTVKNLATYEELGTFAQDTGTAKAGDAKNPGKFTFTMTGGSYTQKNVLFQNDTGSFVEEKDLYADVLFTGVKVTCDESMFLNNNEFDCTEPLTFKDCEIRHNGGGRFNNSHCKGNRFVVIDGGTFSAAGTDALCWKTLVKAGTVFDKLDYLKNNDNGMGVADEGVAIIKDAAGYKVVAIDELPEDAQFVIYRANTQPNKHYTLACFDTLDAALAEVKGGDVLTVNPSKKGFETSYTWNVPAGNIAVNLCGNFIEAYSDFIVVNNATTLTFNNGCFIADAKLLTVNNDSAVINFVGEDAEENPFVLSTAIDTGMIEIVAGSVNFTNTSVEAIKVVGEGDDMEEVAIEDKNLVLLGEGYTATDSTYNGEKLEWIVYHMFSVTNGNVVTYGKTLDEFVALLKTSPATDIVITLLDDVRFVETVEVKLDPVATGSYTLDLNGHNLCLDGYKLSLYSNYPLTIKNSADTLSKIVGKWTDANHTASGKTDRDGDTLFAVSRASSKLFIEGANIQAFGSQLADVDNGATFVANGLYYNMCVFKKDGIFKLGNGGKPTKMECNNCTFVIENTYGPVLVKAVHGELVFNDCTIYAAEQTRGMFLDSFSTSHGTDTPVIRFNGCRIFGNLAQFDTDKGLKAVLDENCIVTAYDPAIVLVPEGYELVAADKTESVKVIDVTFDFETYPTTETPTEAVAHYAVAKKASAPALHANLTLYSNIAYNIYVSAQDYARITAAKYVIGEIEYPLAFAAMGDEYYVASIEFGAAFIADKFNVEITADEETYVWEDLSVLAYASAMMETVDDAEKTAIASMVAYAKVVAGLLGEVPADLVAFDTELAKADAVEIVAGETAEGITATYALGTEAGLRLHATEGIYTITFNGEEITHDFAEDNDVVIIIRAYHMGDDVVVSLGANEYCYNIANFAEGDLATAVANYAAAVAALAD